MEEESVSKYSLVPLSEGEEEFVDFIIEEITDSKIPATKGQE